MKYKFFLDMDDVITDLHGEIINTGKIKEDIFRKLKEKSISDNLFWKIINKKGVKFWSEMPWTSNGKKLWKLILPGNPTILSAYSKKSVYTVTGKKIWIKNNLGNVKHILCLRKDKKNYAYPSAILIDDRKDNIDEWKKNGGIGILYHNDGFDKFSLKIKKYLNEK